ncbi:MAG: hypothetical protein ACLR6B_16980 [Blautia sp.]
MRSSEEFEKNGLEGKIWQYFHGCSGFQINRNQKMENVLLSGAVSFVQYGTTDVMTATVAELPHELMVHITDRITHEVAGINRVLYDFTPKPTGTVEFE